MTVYDETGLVSGVKKIKLKKEIKDMTPDEFIDLYILTREKKVYAFQRELLKKLLEGGKKKVILYNSFPFANNRFYTHYAVTYLREKGESI